MASELPIDRAQINCPDSLPPPRRYLRATGSERSCRMCKTWLGASLRRSTRQRQSRICAFRLVTDWRNCRGIGKGSGASALTTNGVHVFVGKAATRMISESRTII